MDKNIGLREKIVDAAIDLAEASDWEAIRLYDVADRLGLSLDDIRQEFSEKDELIDAWFDRADSAMLQDAASPEFCSLTRKNRIGRVMMKWLDALAAHRRVTRQMMLSKLEPGHIHIQFPGLMRVSRTVQWMREAAGYDASFPRRAAEEVVHTGVYLATFAYWMSDDSPQSERTRGFLARQLAHADIVFSCCGGGTRPDDGVRKRQRPPTAYSDT
jgi:AcrR family transcriptional regulator